MDRPTLVKGHCGVQGHGDRSVVIAAELHFAYVKCADNPKVPVRLTARYGMRLSIHSLQIGVVIKLSSAILGPAPGTLGASSGFRGCGLSRQDHVDLPPMPLLPRR